MVSAGGESRGKHDGVHNFTVGQRKGLGLSSPSPLYVISIAGLDGEMRAQVKIRHRHEPAWATLRRTGKDEVEVRFDEAVRAVTPGQAAVFYAGDEVIGGGWIV